MPARGFVIVDSNAVVKWYILYPATTGRNFDEIFRCIKSLKLTAIHRLATPVNWKDGERCIVSPPVPMDEAQKMAGYQLEELPSGKKYLRSVDCPSVP